MLPHTLAASHLGLVAWRVEHDVVSDDDITVWDEHNTAAIYGAPPAHGAVLGALGGVACRGGVPKGERLLPARLPSGCQKQALQRSCRVCRQCKLLPLAAAYSYPLLPHSPSQLCSPNFTSITWLRLPTRTSVLYAKVQS